MRMFRPRQAIDSLQSLRLKASVGASTGSATTHRGERVAGE